MSDLSTLRQTLLDYQPDSAQEEADREIMLDFLEKNPDCLLRSNKLAHFTASSWILDESGQQSLMVYHNIYDAWSWTGGHADGEADPLAVAIKEAQEETGLQQLKALKKTPISLEVITVEGHWKRGSYVPAHLHLNLTYLLQASSTQALQHCPEENQGVRWVPRAEVLTISGEEKMFPIYRKLNQKADAFLSSF